MKFFKKNNIFKVVCITVLVVLLLTWIIPAKTWDTSSLGEATRTPLGIVDLVNYLIAVPQSFGYVALYIFVVGGFYGVLYKTNGYRNMLEKTARRYSGNEWRFLVIELVLVAVISSITGFDLGLVVLFPFIFAQLLIMGYSKVTAVFATVGPVAVGTFASTYAYPESLQIAYETLGLTPQDNIVFKLVLFFISLVLLVANVLLYANKHKIDSARKGFLYPETSNKNAKSWPIALCLYVTFIIVVISTIAWSGVFEISLFTDIVTNITKVDFLSKLFGEFTAFGNWSTTTVTVFLLFMTAFVALLGKVNLDDAIDGFAAGLAKAARPAIITTVATVMTYIMYYNAFTYTILESLFKITKNFNVVTMTIGSVIMHFMEVMPNYAAYYALSYPVSVFTDSSVYGVMQIIFQASYGLAMLFVPTSLILVATLSYSKVSYGKWIKAVGLFLLELFVLLLVFSLIMLADWTNVLAIISMVEIGIVLLAFILSVNGNSSLSKLIRNILICIGLALAIYLVWQYKYILVLKLVMWLRVVLTIVLALLLVFVVSKIFDRD